MAGTVSPVMNPPTSAEARTPGGDTGILANLSPGYGNVIGGKTIASSSTIPTQTLGRRASQRAFSLTPKGEGSGSHPPLRFSTDRCRDRGSALLFPAPPPAEIDQPNHSTPHQEQNTRLGHAGARAVGVRTL
jgi:hypothetical protein